MSFEGRVFGIFVERPIMLLPLAIFFVLWLIFKNLFAFIPGAIKDFKKGGDGSSSKIKEKD